MQKPKQKLVQLILFCAIAHSAPALACHGQFKPLFQVKINKTERETHTMGIVTNGDRPTHLYYSNPNAKKADKRCLTFELSSLSKNQALMEEMGHVGAMIRLDSQREGQKDAQKLILQYSDSPQWKFMTTVGEKTNDSDFARIELGFHCPVASNCKVSFNGKPLLALDVTVKTQKKNNSKACEEKVVGIQRVEPALKL